MSVCARAQPRTRSDAHRSYLWLGLVAAFLAVFFLLPSFAEVYTDWLWFLETGHEQVFVRTLSARVTLGAVTFALVFGVLSLNIHLAQRGLRKLAFTVPGPQGPSVISIDPNRMRPVFLLGAALVAFFVALFASGRWDVLLMARNAVPFGQVDPILSRDISFYLFQLPLLQFLHVLLFITLLLAFLASGLVYFVSQAIVLEPQRGLLVARRRSPW